jgi:hypothetical protein
MDSREIDAAIAGAKARFDHADAPHDPDVLALIRAAEALREEEAEARQLFELQWRRMGEATARWRAEDPEARAAVIPDLGELLKWLMDDADRARQPVRAQAAAVDPDPMPVFVIKGKDRLASEAVAAYSKLCLDDGLDEQWAEVEVALAEIIVWQQRHPELVKTPDHKHVPAVARPFESATDRYAGNMRAAGLDVTVTQVSPGQVRVPGRRPAPADDDPDHGEGLK